MNKDEGINKQRRRARNVGSNHRRQHGTSKQLVNNAVSRAISSNLARLLSRLSTATPAMHTPRPYRIGLVLACVHTGAAVNATTVQQSHTAAPASRSEIDNNSACARQRQLSLSLSL
eukprot:scpid103617/ scgid35199/ 